MSVAENDQNGELLRIHPNKAHTNLERTHVAMLDDHEDWSSSQKLSEKIQPKKNSSRATEYHQHEFCQTFVGNQSLGLRTF